MPVHGAQPIHSPEEKIEEVRPFHESIDCLYVDCLWSTVTSGSRVRWNIRPQSSLLFYLSTSLPHKEGTCSRRGYSSSDLVSRTGSRACAAIEDEVFWTASLLRALLDVLSHEYLSQNLVLCAASWRTFTRAIKILYGQSIGDAVATDLPSRNPHAVSLYQRAACQVR